MKRDHSEFHPTPELISDTVTSLNEMLKPGPSGEVAFGVDHEGLRTSQIEALQAVRNGLMQEPPITRSYIVQPGGSGKTREGIALAYALNRHGRNTLFVVPNQQALEDFAAKARKLCPDLDVGAVYQGEKQLGRLTFITYASLLKRTLGEAAAKEAEEQVDPKKSDNFSAHEVKIDPKHYHLVVWDEAHMYLTPSARNLMQKFDSAINIGLTATPRYYPGKEVEGVFGTKLHEINLETAVHRGEVCPYQNILVDTNIHSGLDPVSRDQEESTQVSAAINRRDRNLIAADLYKNAQLTMPRSKDGKKFTMAGEPAIVFGAGIQHVNDMAKTINDALAPALKTDALFRARLKAKGINPDDPELVIAAPIHSGGNGDIQPMSLEARNDLLTRYHQRKVLMLCATSVLQQSFDSPQTSVVIDTVPRQTYVGVGQAAQRATRPGKDLAVIVNMQDKDNTSLTFTDFEQARGREHGVVVEIAGDHKGGGRKRLLAEMAGEKPVAAYSVRSGEELQALVRQRREQEDEIYRSDFLEGRRHFTPEGYKKLSSLMEQVGKGNADAKAEFHRTIGPWMDRQTERIGALVRTQMEKEGKAVDEERFERAREKALESSMRYVENGSLPVWSRFAVRYVTSLKREMENSVVKPKRVGIDTIKRLQFCTVMGIPQPDTFEHAEALKQKIRDIIDAADIYSSPGSENTRQRIKTILKEILDGKKYEEIGERLDKPIVANRVSVLKDKGYRTIRESSAKQQIDDLRDAENRRILLPLKEELQAQFSDIRQLAPIPEIGLKLGKESFTNLWALCNNSQNDMITQSLLDALKPEAVARLRAELPRVISGWNDSHTERFDQATHRLGELVDKFFEKGGVNPERYLKPRYR